MADNYLERKRLEYEERKKRWLEKRVRQRLPRHKPTSEENND